MATPLKHKIHRHKQFFLVECCITKLIFSLLLSLGSYAQLLPVKIYTTKDGLSSNAVQAALQDSRGILWFGTNNGVNWYDGSHIISPPMTSKSGQIFVNDLYEDKQHNIWVCSYYSGLYKFDGKRFYNFLPDSLNLESSCNNIFKIIQLDDKEYLVATDCNVFIFDGNRFTFFDKGNSLLSGQVNNVAVTPNRDILIVRDRGILYYRFINGQWTFQRILFEGYRVNDILISNDECWISTNNGLFNSGTEELLSGQQHFKHLFQGKIVYHLFKDTRANLWACADRIYKITANQLTSYGKENGLPTINIQDVFMDTEGNTWFASQAGVAKMNNEFYRFFDFSLLSEENNNSGIERDSIISALIELRKNKIDYIFFLFQDHSKRLWAGTSSGLFEIVNNQLIKRNPLIPRSIYEDETGNTWIGTQNNIILRFTDNKFYPIKLGFGSPDLPEGIYKDRYGFLWIGFAATGVKKYRMIGDSMILVKEYNSGNGYPNIRTRCLIDDKKGHLIFGTRTNGIIAIPISDTNQRPVIINNENGLPATWIRQMVLTEDGNILMTSNNGLYELKTNDYLHPHIQLIPFVNDKVPTELDNIYKKGNSYWIMTGSGIIQYFPALQKHNSVAPNVYLTKVNIDGRPDSSFSPYSLQNQVLHLASQNNNISLEFTATSFTLETSVLYRYMLEGADKDWGPPVKTSSINYSHLKPGSYTFKVMAANNDGVWSVRPATFTFIIASPFWQRWWFILLSILLIAFILYFIYRYRMRLLLNLEKLRTNISTDLHDDIGSTLSSISILSDMALRQKKPEDAGEMVNEIKQNSISLMERMDDIVWSINPKNDTLENLLVRVRDFAAQLFEAKDIDYSIEIEEGTKLVKLPMEYRQHIYMILKEAINNMVKYSGCTKAIIRVAYLHGELEVVVEDNGKGFDVDGQTTGNGLYSMRRRAALMKAKISINSSSSGTRILLNAKIK